MYVPYSQTPLSYATLMVRTTTDAAPMTSAVKSAVQAIDREQPLYDVMTMARISARSVARRRFTMQLLAIFAGVALALAAVGIYGTLAYTVSQRTNEIGIRLALGAQTKDVMKLIIGQGMKLILIAVGLGLMGAAALTGLMASLLCDISATDPATFAVIALVLICVALLACYLPARRAAKVDRMIALRYE